MSEPSIKLEQSWKSKLESEFRQPYMVKLRSFLKQQYGSGKTIYPKGAEFFAALDAVPFEEVKVVILGQDPYHGPGQAHGLCFSVRPGVPIPPSLINIMKELQTDLGCKPVQHGFLDAWTKQGVLLLNSVLTVQKGVAGSHRAKGWESFTDQVVSVINAELDHVVFLLWGSYAQKKGACIDRSRHLVLESVHPSPLSAHRGFFGCRHFSKANEYLEKHNREPIQWQLPASPVKGVMV